MKTVKILIIALFAMAAMSASAQATKQLNFGLIGISYDIPVHTDIAVAPFIGTNFDLSYLTLGVKGNYYFDNIIGLPEAWDFFAGVNAGYGLAIENNVDNDFDLGLQVGGRWFWNDKWGLYLELGAGKIGPTSGLGITMKL